MELRTARELRRNERLTKAMVKEKEGKGAAAPVQPKPARQAADKLTLSRQALGYLQEQSRLAWEREQRRQSRMDDSFSALDTAKDQLDAMEKKLKVMNKCQKIAASIMRGDRVPPEDMAYLMNNDPEGYKLAMAMRGRTRTPRTARACWTRRTGTGRPVGRRGAPASRARPQGERRPLRRPRSEKPCQGYWYSF